MDPQREMELTIGQRKLQLKEFTADRYNAVNRVLQGWFMESCVNTAKSLGWSDEKIAEAAFGEWRREALKITITTPDGIAMISTLKGCILILWGLCDEAISFNELEALLLKEAPTDDEQRKWSKRANQAFNALNAINSSGAKPDAENPPLASGT